ncbi:hypothetical protein T552_02206 [Pneumocystis carinii B80]|uniref:Uncharacterized protein n=1 Tax=Pneumocystis carinii (strain B80) TaxID=1408658 RepID=A0A0W4ZHA8_PNEC8|nr:hypothetical protein T552_02206 [Pneumocystis carinii B80]KTW27766.1 hypothetical protein T552_02206 [Pneumocystis carinii B80]
MFSDVCEYWVYLVTEDLLCLEDQLVHLKEVQEIVNTQFMSWTKEYIWHYEPFRLEIQDIPGPVHLYGKTNFREGNQDEWTIVFILREITRNIKDIYVRIIDSDGEFLLIESSRKLPRWINEKNSAYRVWMNQGRLLIIPPENDKKKKEIKGLTLSEGLFFLRNKAKQLIHDEKIEKEAFRRIKGYPEKMKENLHRTQVIVPRKIAHILHTEPNLISAAIHEFCQRDPISFKVCEKMKYFYPEDMVSVVIKMTKTLYAQLKGQLFEKHPLFNLSGSDYDQNVMGMKITYGFEMLTTKIPKNRPEYSLKSDPEWKMFIKKLNIAGYFENEKEGSEKYKSLEKHAEECFLKSCPSNLPITNNPGLRIFNILEHPLPTDEEIAEWPNSYDSDSFLNVSPEELDELMRSKTEISSDEDNIGETPKHKHVSDKPVESVIEKFEDFINNENAGLYGAELECDSFTDDTTTDSNISFDADEFIKIMKETLDFADEPMTEVKDDKIQSESLQDEEEEEEEDKLELKDFMDAMDTELLSTTLKDSFSNLPNDTVDSINEQDKIDANMHYNLLKNLYESVNSQQDATGPANTMLKSMHLSLPSTHLPT